MLKIFVRCGGLMAIATTLFSCYKDEGNYDYLTPNTVEVTYPEKDKLSSVYMNEECDIHPELKFSSDNLTDADFDFYWVFNNDTISTNKNLEYTFKQTISDGKLYHYVTDKKSGYVTMNVLDITILSRYSYGWAVLTDDSDKSVLSFVLPEDGSYTGYPDLFKTLHPDIELGTKPIGLNQAVSSDGSLLTIMQHGGNQDVELEGGSYLPLMTLSEQFQGGTYPSGFQSKDLAYKQYFDIYLGQDGRLYSRIVQDATEMRFTFFTGRFLSMPMQKDGEDLCIDQIIPMHYGNSEMMLLFDRSKNRFLGIPVDGWDYTGNVLSCIMLPTTSDGGALSSQMVDLNNLGDWNMVYCGVTKENYRAADIVVLLEKGGEYKLQYVAWNMYRKDPAEVTSKAMLAFDGSLVSADSKFKALSKRPYMFFSNGNNLYWYDRQTQRSQLFYTFKSPVVDMDFDFKQTTLGVGLSDGTFVVMDIADSQLNKAQILFEKTFPGKMVDVLFKYSDLDTWYYGN